MGNPKRGKLFQKFALVAVPTIAVTVLGTCAVFLVSQQRVQEREMRDRWQSLARLAEFTIGRSVALHSLGDVQEFVEELTRQEDVLSCAVFDADLACAFHSNLGPASGPAADDLSARAVRENELLYQVRPRPGKRGRIARVAVPVHVDGEVWGVARIDVSTARYDAAASWFYRNFVLLALLFVCVGILGSMALARYVAKPVVELARQAQRVAGGDLDASCELERNDELGILAASFDGMVANLRVARDEIQKARLYVEDIFESMTDSLIVVHAGPSDGPEPKEFIHTVNRATLEMLGCEVYEILGEPIGAVFTSREYGDELREALREKGSVTNREAWYRRRDGSECPVRLSASVLRSSDEAESGDRMEGFVLVARDVTNVHTLEAQLRQSQKMEAVGKLAGGLAHDFNNLVSIVTGYSEMLLGTLEGESEEHELVVEIRKAGNRAARLVRQLLAFSRKQVLKPRILDLRQVLREMDSMLDRLIEEDVELETRFDPVLGHVLADPGQIEQVVVNLVLNARDALPDGGRITIEAGNRFLGLDYVSENPGVEPGNYVEISVADDGCGMDEKTRARIFEPFFTTKEVGKGSGLGLATVYGIVKQSGGHLTVESDPGRGTTFRIYLRQVQPDGAEVPSAPPAALPVEGSETVLLAEDEQGVRRVVAEVLGRSGYRVLPAENGEEALRIAEQFREEIDLLLTDVVMPKLNGRELAGRLLRNRPDVRVIYMSGYTDTVVFDDGDGEAEARFIEKPFPPADLTTLIREVLDARPAPLAG